MKHLILACMALVLAMGTAKADDITEALQSAIEAYEEGDTQYALEELDYAKQLLQALKTDALVGFLPEAPDGWTREVDTEMNAGMAFMGGGTGAEATYNGDGQSMTITVMADNPMVAGMAGMIGNAALIGAKIERIGREKFMVMEGEINGLIDNRILVKASGGEVDAMLELLETMDFKALGQFGS
ncbi:MAG: hypothetical protein AAFY25_01280 [Pseudomonadota bacterium]